MDLEFNVTLKKLQPQYKRKRDGRPFLHEAAKDDMLSASLPASVKVRHSDI